MSPQERSVESEVIVVGGGISGLAFAMRAVGAGHTVRVLERGASVGGCIQTARGDDGYWFELGAHTVYNSYGGLIELIERAGVLERVLERAPVRKRFGLLRDGAYRWLTPPKVLLRLNWLSAAGRFPWNVWRKKEGLSVRHARRLRHRGDDLETARWRRHRRRVTLRRQR
jgi:UDP-galactopyranose mutase